MQISSANQTHPSAPTAPVPPPGGNVENRQPPAAPTPPPAPVTSLDANRRGQQVYA